jgi:hypothetical protein
MEPFTYRGRDEAAIMNDLDMFLFVACRQALRPESNGTRKNPLIIGREIAWVSNGETLSHVDNSLHDHEIYNKAGDTRLYNGWSRLANLIRDPKTRADGFAILRHLYQTIGSKELWPSFTQSFLENLLDSRYAQHPQQPHIDLDEWRAAFDEFMREMDE